MDGNAAASCIADNRAALLAQQARGDAQVHALPFYYHVHLNEPCNQKCIMCKPNGRHGKSLLPFDAFRRFYDTIAPYAEHITLIGGEPLLYPWIDDVLALLAQRPIAVSINSNVTQLDSAMCARLLALHEITLRCSIDAATRSTYLRIRGTDVFDRVSASIAHFAALAQSHPRAHVLLNYVVMRENLSEVLPFVELMAPLRPFRIEFHPVRHVDRWQVDNGTGWHFDGKRQSCESFRDEYNDVMRRAAARCAELDLAHEVQLI
jgi:molybdenum cofactor biosynthesis enzyme MoaA